MPLQTSDSVDKCNDEDRCCCLPPNCCGWPILSSVWILSDVALEHQLGRPHQLGAISADSKPGWICHLDKRQTNARWRSISACNLAKAIIRMRPTVCSTNTRTRRPTAFFDANDSSFLQKLAQFDWVLWLFPMDGFVNLILLLFLKRRKRFLSLSQVATGNVAHTGSWKTSAECMAHYRTPHFYVGSQGQNPEQKPHS